MVVASDPRPERACGGDKSGLVDFDIPDNWPICLCGEPVGPLSVDPWFLEVFSTIAAPSPE
jgi:hypothetical protein